MFFRASTRDTALALGLSGHAINLPDGSVEVLACGEAAAIDDLRRWLADGPPLARVAGVSESAVDCSRPAGFVSG